jgi:hypothetical protein
MLERVEADLVEHAQELRHPISLVRRAAEMVWPIVTRERIWETGSVCTGNIR